MNRKRVQALAGIGGSTQLDLMESVIYSKNSEDPSNPKVIVPGVGRYSLKELKADVREKLKDLVATIDSDDPKAWDQAAWKLKHNVMHEMMATIKAAHDELMKR